MRGSDIGPAKEGVFTGGKIKLTWEFAEGENGRKL